MLALSAFGVEVSIFLFLLVGQSVGIVEGFIGTGGNIVTTSFAVFASPSDSFVGMNISHIVGEPTVLLPHNVSHDGVYEKAT